jgi:hypothetical protein
MGTAVVDDELVVAITAGALHGRASRLEARSAINAAAR